MGRDRTQDWFLTSEFADLAGVTVRTLRYYDRVGLLKVARTKTGYRRNHLRDLERLEQIVALKFLGLSLLEIRRVIDGEPISLVDALVRQRDGLLEKRQLLNRALCAIEEARTAISKGRSTTELLRKIIEVMEMQNESSWMMKYYSPDAQAKLAERAKAFTAEDLAKISQDWKDYYRDVAAMTAQGDIDGSKATDLAARHRELLARFTGSDPEIEAGLAALYRDRGNWPQADDDRMREYEKGT
jgi:MerR family transcriptional regulator, thiopeptide resistance regulator